MMRRGKCQYFRKFSHGLKRYRRGRATELLFLKYMMDSLRPGGRCGVIVPEGVLFGSTGAHKELRRQLIENNRVEAVMSLPGGVFQPYSGVKTSVLFFKKGGTTDNVLFLHADNDGYKLDANHDTPIEADDLSGLIAAYRAGENAATFLASLSTRYLRALKERASWLVEVFGHHSDQDFRAVMRRFFDDWVEEFQNIERSLGGA